MRLNTNFGFLCDYADNSGGKLNAIGIGFDTIYARTEPISHHQLFAVLSINFSSAEVGTKRVGLHIIDADGKDISPPMDQPINVPAPQPGYLFRTQRIVLGLRSLNFPAFGDYSVIWLIDGTEVHHMTVKVAPPPSQPTTV